MSAIGLVGGATLGLASSLHCIGMCGGISMLLSYAPGPGARATLPGQLLLHGGRITSYMTLGALAGALGQAAIGQFEPSTGHLLLRWSAAVSLGWIGLSTAGLMPAPALFGHAAGLLRVPVRAIFRLPMPVRRIVGGLAWGLLPCGMIYGALLFAMFAGSALDGALVLLGFGLGTLPALIAAQLGFERLKAVLHGRSAGRWIGVAMTALAMLSLVDRPAVSLLCGRLATAFGS
ncbi:sulfite exporter TauE/SafE family protein [Sphingobium nicotianae]|uniref:Sulfite exporter TauE/SafE family protein n=1 Tax=Sphingobium nicotianae TaxID=2782607 RepID=A0A9X1ISY8_9SPHN|nr:sulfite exporter TauE/SafE family protein [Sphingobium nicotianae]MBT2189028.1 sulfite exporter TauE/SafE family protein [Sphingobium nicotianae]